MLKLVPKRMSTWSKVPLGPPDAILGVTEAFKADTNANKMNLGVGAYRDDKGKPYVLDCVRRAEQKLFELKQDKEYLPIAGLGDFTKASAKLAYGAQMDLSRVAITQSLSGTGALRIGGAFLARHYPHAKSIYLPTPSWYFYIQKFVAEDDVGEITRRYLKTRDWR